jgi:hypothetical protein
MQGNRKIKVEKISFANNIESLVDHSKIIKMKISENLQNFNKTKHS